MGQETNIFKTFTVKSSKEHPLESSTNKPDHNIELILVGIATGYGLDDRGVGVRVPVRNSA
jgi:hypothetical protein